MTPQQIALMMAVPSAVKGFTKLLFKPPQQGTSSDVTNYQNKLRNISKEGVYGQGAKNEIMTDISQEGDKTAQKIRGTAVKQGIENSGVLAQQLIEQGNTTTLQKAKMARKIAELNERSKIDATRDLASVSQGIEDRRYNNALLKFQRQNEIIGDFADAGSAGISGYTSAKAKGEMDKMLELFIKYPDLIKLLS